MAMTRATSAPTIAGKYLEHLDEIEVIPEAWWDNNRRIQGAVRAQIYQRESPQSPSSMGPSSPRSLPPSGGYGPAVSPYVQYAHAIGPETQPTSFTQYGHPIGPPSIQQVPQGTPRGGNVPYIVPGAPTARVTYDYSRMPGGRPSSLALDTAKDYGTVAAAIPVGIWRGVKYVAPKIGPGIEQGIETALTKGYAHIIQPRLAARNLAKETKAAMQGRLGTAPPRIVNDIIRLKQHYVNLYAKDDPAKAKQYLDLIDTMAKEAENQVQNWDYGERQAFGLQAATIQRRYKEVGKKMARSQGRQEFWRILGATPRIAWKAKADIQDRAKAAAQDVRDRELQARSGQIQKHIRDVDRFRDQYVDQIQKEVEQRAQQDRTRPAAATATGASESLQLHEGKARNFRELMRNKGKVRDRHLLALKRGTIRSAKEKEKGKRKRGRDPFDPPTMTRRVGRKTTLSMRKSRQRHQLLRRKIESLIRVVNEETYHGRHPILHTAGQVTSSPVQIPYKAARGVARFTGLNELPDIAREKHRELKHEFVHNFLLR